MRKPIVLVVDDERAITDSLAAILMHSGFNPIPVYTGRSALDRARTTSPDFAIIDVILPDLNGVDIAKALKEINPKCRVLLFSGQASGFSLVEEAQFQGYEFECLPKPVHPKDLIAKIRGSKGKNKEASRP